MQRCEHGDKEVDRGSGGAESGKGWCSRDYRCGVMGKGDVRWSLEV